MNDNNQEFLNAYNRLDNYLKRITGVSENINLISYLERILPEKQQSELKTIRGYKNTIVSHGVNPGYKKPIVPYEWVEWLEDELNYCKMNKDDIADRLKRQVYAKRENNNPNSYAKKQNYAFQKKDTLDKTIVCQQCNSSFVFSEGEQNFYTQHGLETPKLCKSCRNQKKMMQEKTPRACSAWSDTIQIKKDFIIQKDGDSYIVVAIGDASKTFHVRVRLNETGAFLWKKMAQANISEDELVEALLAEYEVDRETATRDVQNLVNKFRGIGILA